MGSSSNSSRPAISESVNSEAPLQTDFVEEIDDGLAQPKRLPVLPAAVADELGELQVSVDPKYLPRQQAPQVPAVPQSYWDVIYEELFQLLELEHPRVPSSVTEGNVATMNLVIVSAGGETVVESILQNHVAGPSK